MSQTNLLQQRKWGSSAPRSSRSAFKRIERPDSAFGYRPQTSVTFLEPSEQQTQENMQQPRNSSRPLSGQIRPLSSRVYMRRTIKKGWVAKCIEDDDEDEISDDGSLDSFFDDDFDDNTQTQALGQLLSCNTLGVESKDHKADWISGELAIPKFHCPRCRDHWYGISAFPCDEELARLIREGKWYTGNENSGSTDKLVLNRRELCSKDKEKSSTGHDSVHLPNVNKRHTSSFQNKRSSEHHIDFLTPVAKDRKKGKRISFKIDGEDDELEGEGSSGLLDQEERTRRKGGKGGGYGGEINLVSINDKSSGLRDFVSGENGVDRAKKNIESSSSASDINSGSSTTLLRGKGRKKGEGLGIEGGKRKGQRGEKAGDNHDYDMFSNGEQKKNGRRKKGSMLESRDGDLRGKDDGTGDHENRSNKSLFTNTDNGGMNGSNSDITGEETKGNRFGQEEITDLDSHKKKWNEKTDSQNSSRFGSRTSLHGGSQHKGEGGRKQKERELIHGKGYMRASSPSQLDWGDPSHARQWLSNTASSSRVSLIHNDSKEEESEKLNDYKKELTLPPVINKYHKNSFTSSDLLQGFELTRAFTFSYY